MQDSVYHMTLEYGILLKEDYALREQILSFKELTLIEKGVASLERYPFMLSTDENMLKPVLAGLILAMPQLLSYGGS